MSKPLSPHDDFVVELINTLGLPRRVVSFTLRVELDKLVTVDCTYYPEENAGTLRTERFTFTAKGEWELP